MNPSCTSWCDLHALISRSAVLLALCLGIAFNASALAASRDNHPLKPAYSAIYVFGDSLSDTGRMADLLGEDAPISCVNGRLSNGPLWIEYAEPQLGLPYEPTTNFSWAGAYTGNGNAFTGLPGMFSELAEFLAAYDSRPHIEKDALYVVFGGANDFFKILTGAATPSQVIPESVENIKTIVTALHEQGARHIVVMDLPDIGMTPRAIGVGFGPTATYLSQMFNLLLTETLDSLDFPVIRVSTFDLMHVIAADPARFGFTNITDMGILDIAHSGTYLFWDDIHPTTRMHALLAAVVVESIDQAVSGGGIPWRGAQGYFWRYAPTN